MIDNNIGQRPISQPTSLQTRAAVYIARGLAALNDSAGVIYRNECERYEMDTTSMRLEEQTQTLTQPLINFNRLYPNPTSNEVFIEYNLAKGESGILEFYNAIGQHFLGKSYLTGTGKMAISFSAFPEGIYFVRLNVNGQLRNFWKVSINK